MADAEIKERRIIVAVDEGEESIYALKWCLNNLISSNFKDTLILLHAKSRPAVYSAMDGTGYLFSADIMANMEKYGVELANRVIQKAKNVCKDLQEDVKVLTKIEIGDPRDVICEMVEKSGADLLVMGSHGYGLIQRAFLGSVSNHCAQNVKCPVMIVKKPKSTAGDA